MVHHPYCLISLHINFLIFRHGGPGGGIGPRDRRYFDPKVYRIILIDQRGAGQSKPAAELKASRFNKKTTSLLYCNLIIAQWFIAKFRL